MMEKFTFQRRAAKKMSLVFLRFYCWWPVFFLYSFSVFRRTGMEKSSKSKYRSKTQNVHQPLHMPHKHTQNYNKNKKGKYKIPVSRISRGKKSIKCSLTRSMDDYNNNLILLISFVLLKIQRNWRKILVLFCGFAEKCLLESFALSCYLRNLYFRWPMLFHI